MITGLDAGPAEAEADEGDAPAPHPGPYDGLLDGIDPDEEPFVPEPGEEEDPEQIYDPLPGFEATA